MSPSRTDSDLQKDILRELKFDPQVEETDIGVIVKHGAVTLTGSVTSYMAKVAAKRAVKRVKGVHAFADEIEVRLPSQMAGTDEDIALRISKMLEWNVQVPKHDIKAEVHHGTVTLSGEVNWNFQRESVVRQVQAVLGVKRVVNDITIRKRATTMDVKYEIEEALRRHALKEASKIRVSVADGTVTLEGSVESFPERDLVEEAAWTAQGVSRVIDKLRVV